MDGLTLTVNGGDGILNVFLPVGYRLTPQTNEILFFIFIVVGIHLIGPNGCRFIQLLSPVTSNNNIQRIQFRVVRCCDSRQSLPSSICPTCENEEPQKKPRPSFKYQFEFDFFPFWWATTYWFLPGLVITKQQLMLICNWLFCNESCLIWTPSKRQWWMRPLNNDLIEFHENHRHHDNSPGF